MPKPPLPAELDRFLAGPRPAVVGVVRPDGSPSTTPVWYEWSGGRVLLNMAADGRRARSLRREPRVALSVLGESWYDHLSLLGRVVELRDDPRGVDLDRLSVRYIGQPYPDHGSHQVSAIIEIDRWHTFGNPGGETG